MASATVSTRSELQGPRWPLRARILAVNLLALVMFAGGILYLDSYRGRLIDQRRTELATQLEIVRTALARTPRPDRATAIAEFGRVTSARFRLSEGGTVADSWDTTGRTYELRDPKSDPSRRRVARALDEAIDFVARAPRPPEFPDGAALGSAWPEVTAVRGGASFADTVWRAPDRTLVVSLATTVPGRDPSTVQMIVPARDITYRVREERLRSFQLFLGVLAATLALSTFLARTIVDPLTQLANAAARVRRGRARDVVMPQMPDRRDEIGRLARALSEMTSALRQRIDATEAFAADVAHELKNPLASLRSAVETLPRVEEPELTQELLNVMADDVARMDRLLSAIADASRLDAEISRTRFVPVDISAIARSVAQHAARGTSVVIEGPEDGPPVLGDPERLGQVVRNLVENALSFSPPDGTIRIHCWSEGRERVQLVVEDEGTGIAPEALETIFERFYSARPGGESFALHSGLGLAIARTIVEAHGGVIRAENRPSGGARFIVRLPRA